MSRGRWAAKGWWSGRPAYAKSKKREQPVHPLGAARTNKAIIAAPLHQLQLARRVAMDKAEIGVVPSATQTAPMLCK
jgi:hypothetical protein